MMFRIAEWLGAGEGRKISEKTKREEPGVGEEQELEVNVTWK
jgi:hypothetical protein